MLTSGSASVLGCNRVALLLSSTSCAQRCCDSTLQRPLPNATGWPVCTSPRSAVGRCAPITAEKCGTPLWKQQQAPAALVRVGAEERHTGLSPPPQRPSPLRGPAESGSIAMWVLLDYL